MTSLLTSALTSYVAGSDLRNQVILGAERRRRWSDEQKLEILAEVGLNSWTVADVARRHDISRQQIYQWRQQLKRKNLRATEIPAMFFELPVSGTLAATSPPAAGSGAASSQVRIVLRSGRELHCCADLDDAVLHRLLRILEAA